MIAQLDADFIRARPWKIWPRLLAYLVFEGRPLTARGRWINPAVLLGYKLWASLPWSQAPIAPIFILGVGRSGTTMLGKILGLHPDVGFLNEPKALWHAALGDDDVIGTYSHSDGRIRMGAEDATSAKIRRLRRFYRAFAFASNSRRVLDKYPELLFRSELVAKAFPDAVMIVILRDGWQVAASISDWSQRHGQNGVEWWGRDRRKWRLIQRELIEPDAELADLAGILDGVTRHEDMAALEWIVTMREVLRQRQYDHRRLHLLRYEDLVSAPAETISAVLEFCGLASDALTIRYAVARLQVPTPRRAPDLHPLIAAKMRETMIALGYPAEGCK